MHTAQHPKGSRLVIRSLQGSMNSSHVDHSSTLFRPWSSAPVRPRGRCKAYLVGLLMGVLLGFAMGQGSPAEASGLRLPACSTEDDPGPCFWDASSRGNGDGRSFVVWFDGSVWF
jgi:hypothetical protein